jgi:molybdenum cofactor guanylyltransferase
MVEHAQAPDDRNPLILILAGGEGNRIGGEKPLRELGGKRLIDHALQLARQYGSSIVIGLRHDLQIETSLPCVLDDVDLQAPLAGLVSGLAEARKAKRSRLLLLPTDMPFLPADLLDRLAIALDRNPHSNVAMARSNGQAHPVCSLWRSDISNAVSDYVATGRRSLFGLAESVGSACADWDELPDPFFNVNSAEDLENARQRIGGQNASTST